MSGTAMVRRPTEGAALEAVARPGQAKVSPERLADLLVEARWHGDRYGARLLSCRLDRAMGGAR
ncbi:hypothetical protein [Streptomyces hygroscopicus]|uniref:hypothetical protein n=1 Tax=Streptomyces hygroscopicus TaxID=1912 RepID=UPI0033C9E378